MNYNTSRPKSLSLFLFLSLSLLSLQFQIFIDSFLHWAGLKTPKYHCHKDSTENLINIEAFTTKTKQNAHGLTLDSDEVLCKIY